MNTNRNGVTENAFSKIDQDKYAEGWERVFGKREQCSDCSGKGEWLEHGVIVSCSWCDSTGYIKKEKN